MTTEQTQQYAKYTKRAWLIYYLAAVVIAALLVLFVANDNEERFFYGLMTLGSAYVFRPTSRAMDRYVYKFTGVEKPAETEGE